MTVVRVESLPDSGNSHRFGGIDHTAPVPFFLLHTLKAERIDEKRRDRRPVAREVTGSSPVAPVARSAATA
jgi:hypothetical protein